MSGSQGINMTVLAILGGYSLCAFSWTSHRTLESGLCSLYNLIEEPTTLDGEQLPGFIEQRPVSYTFYMPYSFREFLYKNHNEHLCHEGFRFKVQLY